MSFPSPAEEYSETKIDLNQYLIEHPAATFFMKASGDGMNDFGIFNGDLLIIDRSIKARSGHIVIAVLEEQLHLKQLLKIDEKIVLRSASNQESRDHLLNNTQELIIWGVVRWILHQV